MLQIFAKILKPARQTECPTHLRHCWTGGRSLTTMPALHNRPKGHHVFLKQLRSIIFPGSSSAMMISHHSGRRMLSFRENSGTEGPEDHNKSSRRTRLLAYLGGFILIHLSILWARRRHRNENKGVYKESMPYYIDPDLGNDAKMFYYRNYLLPAFAKNSLDSIENFAVRESDVFVASFPKSGTTWVQEIVYLIETGLDIESASKQNMEQRFPYLEFMYPGVAEISRLQGKRFIKTHLPHSLLPAAVRAGKGKVIYIARNPKDVAVSYFHFVRMISGVAYKGQFQEFFKKFINDKVSYAPWWKHVTEYWEHRQDENVLFLTYEELQEDPVSSVKKIAEFLNINLSPTQLDIVTHHCSFAMMSQNPASNYSWWDELGIREKSESPFMRKGIVGDWKNYFSPEMMLQIDTLCKDHLASRGLHFTDEVRVTKIVTNKPIDT